MLLLTLATGLRSFESEGLEFEQYQGKYLKNVKGKGENCRDKYISQDARQELDDYIATERGTKPGPLFLTRRGGRLLRSRMDRFLKKVAAHANAKLPPEQHIHLHAHKLRHTSIKKVHDKKGPLEAKKYSGHRSFKQLERYATSTTPEHENMVDDLFS